MGKIRTEGRIQRFSTWRARIKKYEKVFREGMARPRISRAGRSLWAVGYRAVVYAVVSSKTAAIKLRRDLRRAARLGQ